MEFFSKAKAVRLKSHLNKYLIADDDQRSTRQSTSGVTRKARWLVEMVDSNRQIIRLKSCYNRYLTASSNPFLLGMTGHRVLQTLPENRTGNPTIEWQPIRDGFQVKLKAYRGTFLRANGAVLPWRNSVTHDSPIIGTTHNYWTVWDVEAVELPEDESVADYLSLMKRFLPIPAQLSSLELDYFGSSISFRSWLSISVAARQPWWSTEQCTLISIARTTAMDLFRRATAVRLKSVHDKYLIADDDEESVTQDRNGNAKSAKWTVEFVESSDTLIRLKSCYGKFLTASNQPFLLGMTGHKVLQTLPARLDSSVMWEPIRENGAVKFRTRYGNYLRANGGLPPWRNSVTHDIPHRTATQDWIYWEVHVVDILTAPSPERKPEAAPVVTKQDSFASESDSPFKSQSLKSAAFSRQESNDSLLSSLPTGNDGRLIYYRIANELGEVDEEFEELCITFKGSGVNELKLSLEGELGAEGITVCTKSPLNGKLYPLRLQLPPNNATMHVVVVPSSSKGQQDSEKTEAAS